MNLNRRTVFSRNTSALPLYQNWIDACTSYTAVYGIDAVSLVLLDTQAVSFRPPPRLNRTRLDPRSCRIPTELAALIAIVRLDSAIIVLELGVG